MPYADPKARSAYMKIYYRRHKEHMNKTTRGNYKKRRSYYLSRMQQWRLQNRELADAISKRWRDQLRAEILAAYGGQCKCCGEQRKEFLAIDHVKGDGRQHRALVGKNIYSWLRKNKFPKRGFRLLCHNCNFARGAYGYCPHSKEQK